MTLYQMLRKAWKRPTESIRENYRERAIRWRREKATERIARPTRLDRARSLGYKAKEGYVIVRQRVKRGGHSRPKPKAGRRSKRFTTRKDLKISYNSIAEQRAARKYPNLEVLNSYWVGEDNNYYWYEIIFLDPLHPVMKKDKRWIREKQHTRRVFRALTSAGRRSRGLLHKGKGAEKLRPSLNAHMHRGK